MIIDVMPGLTRLFAGHLSAGSALATGIAVAAIGIAVATGITCDETRTGVLRLLRRWTRKQT